MPPVQYPDPFFAPLNNALALGREAALVGYQRRQGDERQNMMRRGLELEGERNAMQRERQITETGMMRDQLSKRDRATAATIAQRLLDLRGNKPALFPAAYEAARQNIPEARRFLPALEVGGESALQALSLLANPEGRAEEYTLSPGAGRYRGSDLIAERPFAPTKPAEQWGEPYFDESIGALVQRNEATQELRKIGAPPTGMTIEQTPGGLRVQTGVPGGRGGMETPKGPLTYGQKAADTEFGKEYVEWRAKGGSTAVQKNMLQLDEALNKLETSDNITGPVIGRTPDLILSMKYPEAVATRDIVTQVAQENLRAILGAQFTEKEGERLIARAYNPKLQEGENAKRVRRLLRQMRAAALSKDSAADYWEKNGTLKGWEGTLYNKADFYSAVSGKGKLTPEVARQYLDEAGGDRARAKKLATQDGWEW